MSALPRSTRLALACLLTSITSAVQAQHHGHPAMQMQDMADVHAVPAPGGASTEKQATLAEPQAQRPDPHAGQHRMHQPVADAAPGPCTHQIPAASVTGPCPSDPSAGHAMAADAGHLMDHPVRAFLPSPTPAERAAAFPDLGQMDMFLHMDDNPTVAVLRGERLEHVQGGGTAWDARVGVGGNFDKFWLRSEGDQVRGEQAQGELQLQWTHATGPWWDRVLSLRNDFGAGPSRQWLGLGVMGLAPYKFEVEAHAYFGQHGRLAARFEAQYELLLSNRLILTPRIELTAYSKPDLANQIGRGLRQADAGLRLRYEFTRQFAPYLGYAWQRSLGDTAALKAARGEPELEHGWVAGLRFWF